MTLPASFWLVVDTLTSCQLFCGGNTFYLNEAGVYRGMTGMEDAERSPVFYEKPPKPGDFGLTEGLVSL